MQRLPIEIHSRIFLGCLSLEPYIYPTPVEAPLLLLQVCRQWRDIALHTPELWSSVNSIPANHNHIFLADRYVEDIRLLTVWLSRARNCALTLALALGDGSGFANAWMEVVRTYRHRMERVRIVKHSKIDLDWLLEGCRILKHLAVEARYWMGQQPLTIAEIHPALETLLLEAIRPSSSTLRPTTWASLRTLAVSLPEGIVYDMDALLTILDGCHSLQALVFGPIGPVTLPIHPRCHAGLRMVTIILDNYLIADANPVLVLPSAVFLEILSDFESPLEEVVATQEECDESPIFDAGHVEEARILRLRLEAQFLGVFNPVLLTVTHLDIQVFEGTDIWQTILTGCPNLRHLIMVVCCYTRLSASPCDPLSHSGLLSLYVETKVELGNLLCAATFPALRELSIESPYYGEPEDVLDFLSRSMCPLERLWILPGLSNPWTTDEKGELRRLAPLVDLENLRI